MQDVQKTEHTSDNIRALLNTLSEQCDYDKEALSLINEMRSCLLHIKDRVNEANRKNRSEEVKNGYNINKDTQQILFDCIFGEDAKRLYLLFDIEKREYIIKLTGSIDLYYIEYKNAINRIILIYKNLESWLCPQMKTNIIGLRFNHSVHTN